MKIRKMTATFGKLEGASLECGPGLNIITAPNEAGKSTWCAFLRAMLYGIPTRERDTKTTLAEKNRYLPWSGSPMAGEVDITHKGKRITLRRGPKGGVPFGAFEAVDTDTGEPVPGLTGENCGETLLGVGRETFQRSAFVGQSGLVIDGDPELEKRIAALVSSGEEDVSFSQVEGTLKGWRNRRKSNNKNGRIPELEQEAERLSAALEGMRELGRSLAGAELRRDELARQKEALEEEAAQQKARQDWARSEQYRKAVGELTAAREALAALEREAGPIPEKAALREAQGELVYFNTLNANLRQAEAELAPARAAAQAAAQAAEDPLFRGLDPVEARARAETDSARVRNLLGRVRGWKNVVGCGLGAAAGTAAGWLLARGRGDFAFVVLGAFLGMALVSLPLFVLDRRRKREAEAGLLAYGAETPEEILGKAEAFRSRWEAAEEAQRGAAAVEESIRELSAQREELWRRLIDFVRPFAPTVRDYFGVSAALSRALSMDENLATARVKVEMAQRVVSSVPMPAGIADGPEPPPTVHSPQETAAALAAVNGELSLTERELAGLAGRRSTLGDPAELEARRDAAVEELERRRREHAALNLALDVLSEANGDLQARFSPELNRRAGEIFSALTGGKYEGVALTREFEASARETAGVLPRRAVSLSRGTVDQLYLAVRLAVCELALPGVDPAPLVLDDALSDFDDERMALALGYLRTLAETRQVLLFTCHGRERACIPEANAL